MKSWKLVVYLAVALGAATGGSFATTAVAPASVEQLAARADLAVEGRVLSVRSYKVDQRIFTDIDVEVLDAVKGKAARKVTLRLYGGTVGRTRTRVIGAPCLGTGEEVFLFLAANGAASFNVVNLAEGKFTIRRSAGGDEVERDVSDIAYIEPQAPAIPRRLADLKAAVRAAAKAAPAARVR